MKTNLSEEQFDRLMRTLVTEAAADEATTDAVADSRATWWGIQRQINEQKNAVHSPWPTAPKLRRWLLIGIPATAVAFLAFSFAMFRAGEIPNQGVAANAFAHEAMPPLVNERPEQRPAGSVTVNLSARPSNSRFVRTAHKRAAPTQAKRAGNQPEMKTEFIALSYAERPESGQIVRVRVPSSMLVALGVVASVEKPSSLVNAEVVVGDDGLTYAIRFIR